VGRIVAVEAVVEVLQLGRPSLDVDVGEDHAPGALQHDAVGGRRPQLQGLGRQRAFWASCRHDIAHAGGFLVLGAMAAASLNVLVPANWLQRVADRPVLSILALALLAVVLSICSEADAFVAASLTQFSMTARLAFLVVGPMIDLKLFPGW
jgi:hypothetical protein